MTVLSEEAVIDKIEVLETGHIQVRTATRILRDGVVVSTQYHRTTLSPNTSLIGQDARVRAIAEAAWA